MFWCEFSEISKNKFLQNASGRLLLNMIKTCWTPAFLLNKIQHRHFPDNLLQFPEQLFHKHMLLTFCTQRRIFWICLCLLLYNMATYQRRIQNPVQHLTCCVLRKNLRLLAVNYFCKTLHIRFLTKFEYASDCCTLVVFWFQPWITSYRLPWANAPLFIILLHFLSIYWSWFIFFNFVG